MARSHGESRSRLYEIWRSMKGRCLNANLEKYRIYGGRGISICRDWVDSYESFRKWAHDSGYLEHLKLDRIDVNGNYEPNNCRWATDRQQSGNTRKRLGTSSRFKGVTWSRHTLKWRAQIRCNGIPKHLGLYMNEIDAAMAYDAAAKIVFGEFAHTNFSDTATVPS